MSCDIDKWVMNERTPVPRTVWGRYGLAAGIVASAVTALAEILDTGADEGSGLPNIVILLLPFIIAGCVSPFARDAWVGPRLALFDEFEQAAISRATSRAFAIVMGIVAMLFLWFWVATTWDLAMPHTPIDWATLGFALMGIGFALPILLVEIAVPIPPDEGEDGEE